MLIIPCTILLRISCNLSALCSNFHTLLFSKSLSGALKIILLQSMTILLNNATHYASLITC